MLIDQIEKLKKYAREVYGVKFNKNYVLIGVRGFNVSGLKNSDEVDQFNDSLLVVNETSSSIFRCTMDPGLDWIRKPMAAVSGKGTARIQEGLYVYQRGLHRGIEAFTQASMVLVRRDQNRNAVWEEFEPSEKGWFAINIHPKLRNSKNVSTNSAGCTVIDSLEKEKEWIHFKTMLYDSSQLRFPYIVIDQSTAIKILNDK